MTTLKPSLRPLFQYGIMTWVFTAMAAFSAGWPLLGFLSLAFFLCLLQAIYWFLVFSPLLELHKDTHWLRGPKVQNQVRWQNLFRKNFRAQLDFEDLNDIKVHVFVLGKWQFVRVASDHSPDTIGLNPSNYEERDIATFFGSAWEKRVTLTCKDFTDYLQKIRS